VEQHPSNLAPPSDRQLARTGGQSPDSKTSVAVFTVAPILIITIEGEDATASYVNVGGQGPWVARAIATLGGAPVICAPFGGDTGRTAQLLLKAAGLTVDATVTAAASGMYIERRCDDNRRTCIQEVPAGTLAPRDLDDVYEAAIQHGISAGTCVITGSPFIDHLDPEVIRRLCSDLHAAGVVTVADLSGVQLDAALHAGVDWLKVADDELIRDGRCSEDPAEIMAWLDGLVEAGTVRVAAVASSSTGRTLARTPDHRIEAEGPHLEAVDTRGSGDAMCAALALAHSRNHPPADAIRLAVAAGAANAARRSTAAPGIDAVLSLTETVRVDVTPISASVDEATRGA